MQGECLPRRHLGDSRSAEPLGALGPQRASPLSGLGVHPRRSRFAGRTNHHEIIGHRPFRIPTPSRAPAAKARWARSFPSPWLRTGTHGPALRRVAAVLKQPFSMSVASMASPPERSPAQRPPERGRPVRGDRLLGFLPLASPPCGAAAGPHLTIITAHRECSLTRSVVLPKKKRAIRE